MLTTAFDNRTKSAREIWRQMQATRFHRANPKLKINTNVSGSAAAPQVVFTLVDDSQVRICIICSDDALTLLLELRVIVKCRKMICLVCENRNK